MKLRILKPEDSLPDRLKKHRINPDDFKNFKKRLSVFLAQIDSDQYEDHNKNDLIRFLNYAFYGKTNYINIHDRNDLVIRIGKEAYSKIGVIIEA